MDEENRQPNYPQNYQEEEMICPRCGYRIEPRSRFCPACGWLLTENPTQVPQDVPFPAPVYASPRVDPSPEIARVYAPPRPEIREVYAPPRPEFQAAYAPPRPPKKPSLWERIFKRRT